MSGIEAIAGVLRRQAPDAELPESSSEHPRKWLRFPCPFCGKDRASINYALGLFACHHAGCRKRIWARQANPDNWLSDRFQFQLSQAVSNVQGKYGQWVSGENAKDLWQHSRMMLTEYDRTGQLDSWEADVDGDPNQLDRYVLQALNGDLSNWAAKLVRRARGEDDLIEDEKVKAGEYGRTRTGGKASDRAGKEYRNEIRPRGESVEDIAMWISWPTLELKFRQGLTKREIAKLRGVSVRTVDRSYAKEMADARQTYTEKS